MIFTQADIELLRMCAWCKDLPVSKAEIFPDRILLALEKLSFIRNSRQKVSYRINKKGLSVLEWAGYCFESDGQYRSGSILERRLQTAEITGFFWRLGADVFCETPRAEKGTESFLPSFALRRQATSNILGGTRLTGFYYTDSTVFIPYYVASDNEGIYPNVEQRIFHAESLLCGRKPFVVYTGNGNLENVLDVVMTEKEKKEKCTTDSYKAAIEKFSCPVAITTLDENGLRQMRILSVPNYRERLARSILGKSYIAPVIKQSDGRDKNSGEDYIIGIDCNIIRFKGVIKRSTKTTHVVLLTSQVAAVEAYDFGDNVVFETVEIKEVEKALGIPNELPPINTSAFLTGKGETIEVPII